MQYLLTEDEYDKHLENLRSLEIRNQELIGELAELKGVEGCPAISEQRCDYPCRNCPMDSKCKFEGKYHYLPK